MSSSSSSQRKARPPKRSVTFLRSFCGALASNGYFEAGKPTNLPSASSRQTCRASIQQRTAAVSVMVSVAMPFNIPLEWADLQHRWHGSILACPVGFGNAQEEPLHDSRHHPLRLFPKPPLTKIRTYGLILCVRHGVTVRGRLRQGAAGAGAQGGDKKMENEGCRMQNSASVKSRNPWFSSFVCGFSRWNPLTVGPEFPKALLAPSFDADAPQGVVSGKICRASRPGQTRSNSVKPFFNPDHAHHSLVAPKRSDGGTTPCASQYITKSLCFMIPALQPCLFVRILSLFAANHLKCLSMNNLHLKRSITQSRSIKPNQAQSSQIKVFYFLLSALQSGNPWHRRQYPPKAFGVRSSRMPFIYTLYFII